MTELNCVISEKTDSIIPELKSKILKTAAIYKEETKSKKKQPLNFINNLMHNKIINKI